MDLPDEFSVGVATAGFQIEGGYNSPGQPRNNWARWEDARRVEPSGVALRFWDQPENVLDRARALGCDTFRMSIEWARCEPARGEVDAASLERYRAILDACRARHLRPVVTLHHFTHPEWLGADFWLELDSPERWRDWALTAVDALGDLCSDWITINEPNVYALHTYVTGMFPPGVRLGTGFAIRCLDNLLAAHVLAYAAIKERQPDSTVATNTYALSAYELDRLLVDLLLHRSRRVPKRELHDHLVTRRIDWYTALPARTPLERAVRRMTKSGIPLELAFPRTQAAIGAGPPRPLDAIQVDYYDARTSRHLRLPGRRTAGGRTWLPARPLWDDPPDPDGFVGYCAAAVEPGLPLQIAENGLCNRVVDGASHGRLDGWTRSRYLREHGAAIGRLLVQGVPVTSYWHWTLADNYEWGSYEPRFGIFGVDRADPARPVIGEVDSMGDDAASTFRTVFRRSGQP